LNREQLCEALRSRWYLTDKEIDAVLADREFFQPYHRKAVSQKVKLGGVPEQPVDGTDCEAAFLLTEIGDSSIVPDLIKCLSMGEDDPWRLDSDSLTEHL